MFTAGTQSLKLNDEPSLSMGFPFSLLMCVSPWCTLPVCIVLDLGTGNITGKGSLP